MAPIDVLHHSRYALAKSLLDPTHGHDEAREED
jgi:hypothetical protein